MATIRRRALFGAAAVAAATGVGLAARSAAAPAATAMSQPAVLWTAGVGGYERYRIPALCLLPSGTILAFTEARKLIAADDSGDIDVAMRRSPDGGETWGPSRIVQSFAADTAGNPCPVVDPATGDVVLVTCRNGGVDTSAQIRSGAKPARRIYVKRITGDGTAWTGNTEITGQVRTPGWRWYATGPAAAVALTTGPRAGRLVVAANHTRPPAGTDTGTEPKYRGCHLIHSDDGGHTWSVGATSSTPDNLINEDEQAITVLPDGRTLYTSCRREPTDTCPGNRGDATSVDDGASYVQSMRPQMSLSVPACHGSLLTLPDGRLLHSAPGVTDTRAAMTLWTSDNNGRSWQVARRVSGLPAAYSSLALLDDETVGLLYETGDWSPYQRIELERIPITRLE